jgi:hypothetical protein
MKKGENTNENHTLRLTHDKRAIEAHKSNHPQTTDLAIEENPVLAYWKTLQLILPVAKLKTETFNIGFYRGNDEWGKSIANIIRFCVEYADERFSFQDELFFPSENEGGQLNYEVGNTGQEHNAERPFEDKPQFAFIKTPDSLSKHFTRFVSEVQSAAKIKGSFIMVQGYGVVMESNGEQWEFKHNNQKWISPAPKSAHQHPIGYDVNINGVIAHFELPECITHTGKRQYDERAFLTEEGLLFSTEEAKERYLTLYIAGKVELHHENWFADISKWQPINRMMRTSQTTPVEGIKMIEF